VLRVNEIAPEFPTDIEALHAFLATACAERDAVIAERNQALLQNDRLRHFLRQLQRAQFGRRSEKLDDEQLLLALEDVEQPIATNEPTTTRKIRPPLGPRAKASHQSRRASHSSAAVGCDDRARRYQLPLLPLADGEETSERLDVIPAQFRVIVTHRPKCACRACEEAVVQAPAPERLFKGGLPTEAMVAYILVAKYAWHLPLYRQAQMLLAQGIDIKRAILAFWVG
jgi:transposase